LLDPYSDQPIVIKAEIKSLFWRRPRAALFEKLAQIRSLARAAYSYDRVCLPGYFRELGVAPCDFAGKAGLESGIKPLLQHRVKWHR